MTAFTLAAQCFAIAGFSVAIYWMRGGLLYRRATAAYLRGDIAEGDRLAAKARRWSIGTGSKS